MKAQANDATQTLRLKLPDHDAVRKFLDEARSSGAFMVELAAAPKPFVAWQVEVLAPRFEFSFEAMAVQIFPRDDGAAVAWQLADWPNSKTRELQRKLTSGEADETEAQGSSPIFRIKNMDAGKRARLAMTCGRSERHILRRDNSPQVLLSLLSNPRVDAEDVLAIIKSTQSNAGVLQRVASDRRWIQNIEIKNAVVRNPKTPAPIAIRLLDSLRMEDLRQLAKVGALRENVRRAALAAYLKRQGRR